MINPEEWLNQNFEGKPRHERICFLIVANGGLTVHQWGFLSHRGGHQCGLEQKDAIDLIEIRAFMDGATAAGVDLFAALKPYYDSYVKKHIGDMEPTAERTSDTKT